MVVPREMRRQYEEAMAIPNLSREVAEQRFPELLDWLRQRVSLAELLTESGVQLRPISPDAPGVLVGNCPSCNRDTLAVREYPGC